MGLKFELMCLSWECEGQTIKVYDGFKSAYEDLGNYEECPECGEEFKITENHIFVRNVEGKIEKNLVDKKQEPYSRYKNFVEQIKDEGWKYVDDIQSYSLTQLSTDIIETHLLDKGHNGEILSIVCPSSPGHMITICSIDDSGINPIEFYNHSNLYKIPHFFSMTCSDDNGKELSPDVVIDVFKIDTNGKPKKLCSEQYGDMSQRKDGIFKRKEERYYFYESIKLCHSEMLSFIAQSPDIDIRHIKLFMKADFFEKEK